MTPARLRRLRWAVRATLTLGVAASITANVLHAQPHPISQAIAAWPALAFLITVELVTRIPLERRTLGYVRAAVSYGIAAIAAWVSYWHMVDVVARYGETGSVPYLLPLSVDGLIVVASVSLVELAARREALPKPAASTTAAQPTRAVTTSSPAPNGAPVAPTLPVPPVPLPARPATGAGQPPPGADHDPAPDGAARAEALLDGDRDPHAEAAQRGEEPDLGDGHSGSHAEPSPNLEPDDEEDQTDDDQDDDTDDGASLDADLVPLLPAARQARDELLREGRAVSRDALARRLRRNGTAIRNDRVSELLRELRREGQPVNGSRPTLPA
ncbi:DUF2637 domain-containing protein [Krasilnikovia sp. MM14-A1259]|uniref:DUF2637 domain-containing protein n=1 Tax=Krasilnikovia sp. MM14-A1259 TaxID=3373539 RepID=UPI0038217DA5